jgi:ABC-2 type transport system ATP-binding protein
MKLVVDGVSKQFRSRLAVDQLSFEVSGGVIFGLVGPNGAGKTTLIRMLLDIIRPDSGTVRYNGRALDMGVKESVGYLPEERGLYQKMRVAEMLEYFARLKGLSLSAARQKCTYYLDKLRMNGAGRQRVEELSKGNQQKVQVIAVLISDPEVIILDEPFSGLDPINTRETKLLLLEEKRKGRTIILSTHQMNQAEELCDEILMINEGRRVLYGSLEKITADYSEEAFLLECPPLDSSLSFVKRIVPNGKYQLVYPESGLDAECLLKALVSSGVPLTGFRRVRTSLEEIFVQVAKASGSGVN